MTRELLEQMRAEGRLVPAFMYLRKSRAEEHMGLEETLSRHRSTLTAFAEKYGLFSTC